MRRLTRFICRTRPTARISPHGTTRCRHRTPYTTRRRTRRSRSTWRSGPTRASATPTRGRNSLVSVLGQTMRGWRPATEATRVNCRRLRLAGIDDRPLRDTDASAMKSRTFSRTVACLRQPVSPERRESPACEVRWQLDGLHQPFVNVHVGRRSPGPFRSRFAHCPARRSQSPRS